MLKWLFSRKKYFLESARGADLIDGFVAGDYEAEYQWDDFIHAPEENDEVKWAIVLCHFIEYRFPAREGFKEYLHPDGAPYFRRVASLLREGRLAEFGKCNPKLIKHEEDIPTELLALLDLKK